MLLIRSLIVEVLFVVYPMERVVTAATSHIGYPAARGSAVWIIEAGLAGR
jgi:hypothetical protein